MGNNSGIAVLPAQEQQQRIERFNVRMGNHPIIQTNDVITHCITIQDQNLYFQPQNSKHTFAYLSWQYQRYKGVPLILTNNDVEIDPGIQIGDLSTSLEVEKHLELILQRLQQNKSITLEEIHIQRQGEAQQICTIFKKSQLFVKYIKTIPATYECKLNINFNGGVLSFVQSMKIDGDTTFKHIIEFSASRLRARLTQQNIEMAALQNIMNQISSQSPLKNLQLEDQYQNIVEPHRYSQRLFQIQVLKAQHKSFTLHIYSGSCVFPVTSKLMEYGGSMIAIQNFLQDISRNSKEVSKGLMAFDRSNKMLVEERNPELKFPFIKEVNRDFFLQFQIVSEQEQKKILILYKRTLVMRDNFGWIQARYLQPGMRVLGISKRLHLILFHILKVHYLEPAEQGIKAITISSPRFHNLVIENLIVHNRNTITIICNHIHQNRKESYSKSVFHDAKVEEYFKGKFCYFAGRKIEAEDTFADYHIQDNDILYIFQDDSIFPQIAISIRKKGNYFFHQEQFVHNFLGKLRDDYMGANSQKIITFQKFFDRLPKQREVSHIVIDRRSIIQRGNYFKYIEPIYKQHQTRLFSLYQSQGSDAASHKKQFQADYKRFKAEFYLSLLDEQSFFAIHLYTSNRIYGDLNDFLRTKYGRHYDGKLYQKWIATTGWIMKSLNTLQNYNDLCYRGIRDVALRDYLGVTDNNKSICFKSFISTSSSRTVAYERFSNEKGVVLTIRSQTGKDITNFSQFQKEKQILISPFTHFAIIEFKEECAPQTALLEEIPLPSSDSDRLLFWVDDNPQLNVWLVKKMMNKGIQVVQVTSTNIMSIIISKFLWIYKIMGKQILIVSDMSRLQKGTMNYSAGADLLHLMYNVHGLSVKSIIYAGNYQDCLQKIVVKEVVSNRYFIETNPHKLQKQVLSQFRCQ